jgi:hypothetical protein
LNKIRRRMVSSGFLVGWQGEGITNMLKPLVLKNNYIHSLFSFFSGVGVWTHLLGRCSTTSATPPALFALGYFSDRILHFLLRLTSDCLPTSYASWVPRFTDVNATPSSFIELGFC